MVPLPPWDEYPEDYRSAEVKTLTQAICTGECAAIVGLSGSGKSNLVGFLTQRVVLPAACPRLYLLDCNRLQALTAYGLFSQMALVLGDAMFAQPAASVPDAAAPAAHAWQNGQAGVATLADVEALIVARLQAGRGLCLVLDRFDALYAIPNFRSLAGNLRALRDRFKYRLTYITAARRPLAADNELAELFYGATVWLGPLSPANARWSAGRDGRRLTGGAGWPEAVIARLVALSGGYPSLLRAACEAYAAGAELSDAALRAHPAVARRLSEFWHDQPPAQDLQASGLAGLAWLKAQPMLAAAPAATAAQPERAPEPDEDTLLTASEHRLLAYLRAHAGQVCEKDDLVRAIWPEDVVYSQGIRDDSLAQLVRRLRVKVEADPSRPAHILTAPGRGYIWREERPGRD